MKRKKKSEHQALQRNFLFIKIFKDGILGIEREKEMEEQGELFSSPFMLMGGR